MSQHPDRHLPFWIVALLLFLLGYPPVTAQAETLTGWFTFIVADYPPESGLAPEITYTLTEDSGEQHELLIDSELMQPLGGPMALNRKRVTVMGEWEEVGPDATEKFRVYAIELAPSPSPASPGGPFALDVFPDDPPPPGSATPAAEADCLLCGPQAWVTVLCRFADATDVTPYPVSHYEELMESLDPYWQEVSYGNINLTGSVVVGWYNLPQPQSYYQEGDKDLTGDCATAADVDVFSPDFDGINIVFNRNFDDSTPRGNAALGGPRCKVLDGGFRCVGFTELPLWAHNSPSTWAHEMGHGFGLPHSSGPYDETYDSSWDVMSGGGLCWAFGPEPGCIDVHTIAYHKDLLGWIPPARKYVAAPTRTQTIILERLAQPSAEGYLMAQIPIGGSDTNFYTVEARRFAGYDNELLDEAVVIHKVDTTRGRAARVVDVDNNGDPNDEGAMWTVGEIFTDAENGLQISIDAAYATGYRVTINTDPDTFRGCIDWLSASRHIFESAQDEASVQVTAADDCHWSATSNAEWLRITSGGTGSGFGSVRYAVTANPGPAVRTGRLTIDSRTLTVVQAGAGEVLFEDDMEGDVSDWIIERGWALTTVSSRSGTRAWKSSPDSYYPDLFSPWIPLPDLTEGGRATLTFWHRYDFTSGNSGEVWIAVPDDEADYISLGTVGVDFTGTQSTWQRVEIDLNAFLGWERIRISFYVRSGVSETADGWYIDDMVVSASSFTDSGSPVTLENPRPASFQSGVGVLSGWACYANEMTIELDGVPLQAAYGTVREDTRSVCGDADNGFSLLWNWNNLGPGEHTVRALLDGTEFAYTTVRVTTFGEPFLRGASSTFDLSDFPASGETTSVRWEESLQNFVITDGQPDTGGGHSRVAGVNATLENPSLGSAQSGVGVISGWACEAEEIVIELDGTPLPAAYGTVREDTRSVCGDADNGFSLLWNWNNLGPGEHTVRALLDGVEFAYTTVRVTTFGEAFLRGASGTFSIPDFPRAGETKKLRWEQSLQNFVIIP